MTIHSICVIDDGIPTSTSWINDTKALDANVLKYLGTLEKEWGSEWQLKELFKILIDQTDTWDVRAFSHPSFFLNCAADTSKPEILIFDWDYQNSQIDSPTLLLEILNKCFAFVFIYTGMEKAEELDTILAKPEFKPFRNRIQVAEKGELSSETILSDKVKHLTDTSFSFRFGNLIRQNTAVAADQILVELGKATLSDITNYFKLTSDTKRDLVEFLGERFKNLICGIDLTGITEEVPTATVDDEDLAKRLWSYRLYYTPKDENPVYKGDIVCKTDQGNEQFYLVISADCDLCHLWQKNFGFINAIPLYPIRKETPNLLEKLLLAQENNVTHNFFQQSLTARIDKLPEGPFILPFVNVQGQLRDFIAFPKEILSFQIPKPAGLGREQLKKRRLMYTDWVNFTRITSLSEPFLSPITSFSLESILGNATPDFPDAVKKVVKKRSEESLN